MAGGGSSELKKAWDAIGFLTNRIEELELEADNRRAAEGALSRRVDNLGGRVGALEKAAKPAPKRRSRAKKPADG